ncbi:cytochrome BD ubiquinol oxidase subunit I [Anopheles sinensis]|uniref:Cytochrome BD ubiquinol oxidase subunit I n=1 Tax=Anopheles sinensis TaxID=74873 RepID=A0A084VN24_ANOSI|nr:cytochrome BD ubiquinol oxidase subunit I [Anopheles sinensis]
MPLGTTTGWPGRSVRHLPIASARSSTCARLQSTWICNRIFDSLRYTLVWCKAGLITFSIGQIHFKPSNGV